MTNELKNAKKQFIKLFWLISGIDIVLLALIVLFIFLNIDEDIKYIFIFLFLFLIIIFTGLNRNKIDFHINYLYSARLRNDPGNPVKIKINIFHNEWYNRIVNLGYEKHVDTNEFVMFYRISKDTIKKPTRTKILEIVIYIKNIKSDFYNKKAEDEINRLEEKFKKKEKINKLLISQFKEINELDDKTKTEISEIVFIRSNRSIISTVNVGVNIKNMIAVFLYSKYSPSLYYTRHINLINELL